MGERRKGIVRHRWSADDNHALIEAVAKLDGIGYLDALISQAGPKQQAHYWDAIAGVLAVDHGIKVTGSSVGNRLHKIRREGGEIPGDVTDKAPEDVVGEVAIDAKPIAVLRAVVSNQVRTMDAVIDLAKSMSDLGGTEQYRYVALKQLVESVNTQNEALMLLQQAQVSLLMKVDLVGAALGVDVKTPFDKDRQGRTQ